jgi:hypothetical protein
MRRSLAAAALMASLMNPWIRILDPLWSFLGSLGNAPATKEGCGMDPNGRCLPAALPSSDAGCGMDPDGRCSTVPPPSSDAGAGWDPNG